MDMKKLDATTRVGGQVAPDQMEALKAQGIGRLVNNRPDGEEAGQPTTAELERAAAEAGIDYRFIPLARELTPVHIEMMAEAISGDEAVYAFCKSGTRSTMLWALAKARLGGDPEEIASAASEAGYDIAPVRAGVDHFATLR